MEVLEAVVPDMLRTKNLQLTLVMDQLVAQQRSKCEFLLRRTVCFARFKSASGQISHFCSRI